MGGFNRALVQTNEGDRRGARPGDGWLSNLVVTPVAADTNQTMTMAQIMGGVILSTGKTANRNFTLPLATAIDAALPNMDIGDGLLFKIVSGDGFGVVVTANTGVTVQGNTTVATLTAKHVLITKTAASTYVATVM